MKRIGKPTFFVVATLIIAFTVMAIFGIYTTWGDNVTTHVKGLEDIRWGIDIKGGVEATYTPENPDQATKDQLKGAEGVIKQRLVSQNITDSEVYTDTDKMRIVVRFPWPSNTENFDVQSVVSSLGAKAELNFRKGTDYDEETQQPKGDILLTGQDVESATAGTQPKSEYSSALEYVVNLSFTQEGKQKFADATTQLAEDKEKLSIWLDDKIVSAPSVNEAITDGKAVIQGEFTADTAGKLASTISGGSLPIDLTVAGYSTISPTLGMQARNMMGLAAVIAFAIIAIFMVYRYRVPGVAAVIALIGHISATIAAISGFFSFFPSFTLTLPGIAGIILGIGMGVDANVLTASRVAEEMRAGRSIDGAIATGSKRGFTAVFDSNITVLIISIILMGAFGPPDSLFAILLKPIFFMFGGTTEGTIYSFGYTMFVGVICNLIFGVFFSRLMLKSLSKYKFLRKPKFYGGTD